MSDKTAANQKAPLTFETALKRFVTATNSSMRYARICAEMALEHFAEHGNITMAQQLLDAMPQNYVRRAAYLKWLDAHAPITMEGGKLRKDTAPNATEFNVELALSKPFWDFAPDPEQVHFGSDDIVVALKGKLRTFRNDRHVANDEKAMATLEAAEKAVANIAVA
jgi:hypothetical protein